MRGLLVAALVAAPLAAAAAPPQSGIGNTIYLDRCSAGCTMHKGADDSHALTSTIIQGNATDFFIPEFLDSKNQTGAAADAEWNDLVKCVKEVYSPYNTVITDQKPTSGNYQLVIVGGHDSDIGISGAGGIANFACSPLDNAVSFVFANSYADPNAQRRTWTLCGVIAQESAHNYGLSHEYKFADGRSACTDPMTYRSDCGGQQFFRNEIAYCGGFSQMACNCGAQTQNSHLQLLNVFGAGTPITTPPTLTVTQPQNGATVVNGASVVATAAAQRGIAKVELWLNGFLWTSVKGAAWGANGQPESGYSLQLPQDVPDGIIDIVVKAKDDIDATATSQAITVTKGAPCATADTCAKGQRCDAGKCLWDAPSGQFGDACTYNQFCLNGMCAGTADKQICTQGCVVGVTDACPDPSYSCIETSPGQGICYPGGKSDDGGICSAGGSTAAPFAFGAFGVALLLRRRRR